MSRIGFHASHEQFGPEELLALAVAAERAGFEAVMSSDHFHPWSVRQGHSGFSWSWLGAAMQATSLPFGTLCIPGGWRYHPALVAQAAATLGRMFPGRLPWIAAGSGEALNERVVGRGWPDKATRNQRLREGVDMMRGLWTGQPLAADGALEMGRAKLYSPPPNPPRVLGAALTPETARWMGGWADGLITVNPDLQTLRDIVEAFRSGGGAGKPLVLQFHLSFAATDGEARAAAHDQWRSNTIDPKLAAELATPEAYDAATAHVPPEEMDRHVAISADPAQHVAWIEERVQIGFDEIYLHNVGRNQQAFVEAFGREVLPKVPR